MTITELEDKIAECTNKIDNNNNVMLAFIKQRTDDNIIIRESRDFYQEAIDLRKADDEN